MRVFLMLYRLNKNQSLTKVSMKIISLTAFVSFIAIIYNVMANYTHPANNIVPVSGTQQVVDERQTDRCLSKEDSIIAYAESLLGTPYKTAGRQPSHGGFDCSGFVRYVFLKYDITLPASSRGMITAGESIDLEEAAPGDVIVFTGTDASKREAGHVGIVVSEPNEPLRFIHSSSYRGVVYDILPESKNYQKRFLDIRRVI